MWAKVKREVTSAFVDLNVGQTRPPKHSQLFKQPKNPQALQHPCNKMAHPHLGNNVGNTGFKNFSRREENTGVGDVMVCVGDMFVLALPGMTEKWRQDQSIALVDVVDSFKIWKDARSPSQPSSGELLSEFGTAKEDEVVRQILTRGSIVHKVPK
eukprot:TRINITY_DN4937_c0_g1_i1.p1 TRINITY_DN4937_c0_g1~~TRINITY_DN4937_c0_g1_i1.p1  ORF type:complete len:155 (-),score=30.01 TRINITY_DN4937_c0_g1_i1:67-531(-)